MFMNNECKLYVFMQIVDKWKAIITTTYHVIGHEQQIEVHE